MNIEVKQEMIDEAITSLVQKGVEQAIKSYSVENTVKERLAMAFEDGNLANAIKEGVAKVNTDHITQAIALQLQRSATHMVSEVLASSMVDVVAKLRGICDYSDEGKAERQRLTEEFKLSLREARKGDA